MRGQAQGSAQPRRSQSPAPWLGLLRPLDSKAVALRPGPAMLWASLPSKKSLRRRGNWPGWPSVQVPSQAMAAPENSQGSEAGCPAKGPELSLTWVH